MTVPRRLDSLGAVPGLPRLDSLDAARGLAVLLMIFVNFVEQYAVIPAWTKHAQGNGFTYVDGIAPMFIFIMGISSALSFVRRRDADGPGRTALHALKRYGLLFLFGSIGTAILYLVNGDVEWNIFQTLAVAGMAAFPFLFVRSAPLRAGIGLALMGAYQLVCSLTGAPPAVPLLASAVNSLALASLAVFGSGFAGWVVQGKTLPASGIAAAVFAGAGVALSFMVPPNRPAASISYMFMGLAMSAALLLLCQVLSAWLAPRRIPVLAVLGRNALVIFMAASVLTKVGNALIPEAAAAAVVVPLAAAVEAACIAAAWIMDRKGLHVKL